MRLKRFDQINVIPFIDIMLVLLVIVLATASFIAKGVIPLDLPKAQSAGERPLKPVEISIDGSGRIFFGKEMVDPKELEKRVSSLPKKSSILLRTDKKSRFETFVEVLDILKSKGFEKIDLETRK